MKERTPAVCCSGGASSAVQAPWMDSEWQCRWQKLFALQHVYTASTVSFSLCFVCSSLTYYTTIYTKYILCITSELAAWHFCSCTEVKLLLSFVSCPLISRTTAKRLRKCAAKCYFHRPHKLNLRWDVLYIEIHDMLWSSIINLQVKNLWNFSRIRVDRNKCQGAEKYATFSHISTYFWLSFLSRRSFCVTHFRLHSIYHVLPSHCSCVRWRQQ